MTLYHFYWGEAYDELQLAFHLRSADYPTEEAFQAAEAEASAFMDGFVGERESGPYHFDSTGGPREARPDGISWAAFRRRHVVEGAPTPFRRRR
ncbi:hypothetical protein HDA40_001517 [Hamadaea flava]|uniref:Uncharacterized protein n=1 Tax=Hamadaea flava TaxID=1742688 RepID=A0ABV8LRI7_9ACTN|nr:hypothetical protein [Hamadaea flava]MCP2323010.1 hypothetical protein [Hamadaea flava]